MIQEYRGYFQKGSLFVVTPEKFVKEAVGSIGLTKRTSGCFNHEIQVGVLSLSANESVLSAEPERTLDLTAEIETGFMRERE